MGESGEEQVGVEIIGGTLGFFLDQVLGNGLGADQYFHPFYRGLAAIPGQGFRTGDRFCPAHGGR